jgi:electron transfer flavoprotein alpha/beta subunit
LKVVVCVEPWGLSEATRAALALATRVPDATVIALAAADDSAAAALAEAQRLGAQRAAQMMEMALESLDVGALGKTLAEALKMLKVDLVLCGARSDGEGRGVVPAAIAHHWKSSYVPHVESLALSGGEAIVELRAGGRKRRLAVALPTVLTVAVAPAGAPTPRPPSPVEILKLPDAGMRTIGRASDLGTLDRPRRKPAAASSAGELLRRWLERP